MTALWSAVARHRFCNRSHTSQSLFFAQADTSRKRRQGAALQNVGMPTFKVLLEGWSWYGIELCSNGFTPLTPRDKSAVTEVCA